MSETIFEGATTPSEPVVPPVVSTVPQELAELVGEGKKYKSVEDALKSVPHAQTHIQRLEDEMKQMKEELERRKAAEEILEEIRSGVSQGTSQPTKAELNPEVVEQTVSAILSKREAEVKAQTNVASVISNFEKAFGDKTKAQEMYLKVAEESGLSVKELNRLSATSPEAVLKLAGLNKKETPSAGKIHSTVNTVTLNQGHQEELSARVKQGASTRDLVNAWHIAGEKVKQKLGN